MDPYYQIMAQLKNRMNLYYDLGSRDAMKIELYLAFAKISEVDFVQSSTLEGKYNKVDHVLSTSFGDLHDPFSIIKFIARETAHIDSVQNKHLYGDNNYEKSLVDQWIQYYTKQLNPGLEMLYSVVLCQKTVTKKKYHDVSYQVKRTLEFIDEKLKLQNFVCGNFLSLADICLVADLQLAYRLIFTQKYRKSVPYLTKWYENISKREQFQSIYGLDWVCQKQLIPQTFLPQDSNFQESLFSHSMPNPIVSQISSLLSIDDHQNSKQTQIRRNNLGYHYFKRLLKSSDKQKKEKMSLLWQTFELLNCTFWRVKGDKESAKLSKPQLTQEANQLIQKCDQNNSLNDDYGVSIVKKEEGNFTLISVFCFSKNVLPEWMKTLEQTKNYEITQLDPIKNQKDRTFLENIWSCFVNLPTSDAMDKNKDKEEIVHFKITK